MRAMEKSNQYANAMKHMVRTKTYQLYLVKFAIRILIFIGMIYMYL